MSRIPVPGRHAAAQQIIVSMIAAAWNHNRAGYEICPQLLVHLKLGVVGEVQICELLAAGQRPREELYVVAVQHQPP